jgi:hypothetical protein
LIEIAGEIYRLMCPCKSIDRVRHPIGSRLEVGTPVILSHTGVGSALAVSLKTREGLDLFVLEDITATKSTTFKDFWES